MFDVQNCIIHIEISVNRVVGLSSAVVENFKHISLLLYSFEKPSPP